MQDHVSFTRKIDSVIEKWARNSDPHPLLIRGARRTGKTYSVDSVGRRLYGDAFVKLDFQTDLAAIDWIFDAPTDDVDAIAGRIAEYKGVSLEPERSLIFLDEIQLNEKALNSLRFFSGSRWRVIASGSLMGVTTKRRNLPFPSGVRQADIFPMDFEEFLWATGNRPMANAIREHVDSCEPYVLHERALDLYRTYLMIGGMPRVVRTWIETGSLDAAMEELAEIDATYTADMTDPTNGISGISAKRIWDSLPKQLLRSSTKKFKYSEVVRGGRRERLLEPLEWLEAAGIVLRNDLTKDICAPLTPYNDEEGSFFKIYVADTGVMFKKVGISPQAFLDPATHAHLSSDFRGALAENFVMQQLKAAGHKTFYWMPAEDPSRGEVDFVFQDELARVIPVEVKSGRNVRARSLRKLMKTGSSPYCIRLSEENFSRSTRDFGARDGLGAEKLNAELRGLPLYAAFAV